MDFSDNLVLKENYTFLAADRELSVGGGEHGLYNRDTRFLSRYRWSLRPRLQTLLLHGPRPDRLHARQALLDHHHQLLALRRELALSATRLQDRLLLENLQDRPRRVELQLEFDADFADLFEARGWEGLPRSVEFSAEGPAARLEYRARDGLRFATRLSFDPQPQQLEPGRARFALELAPRERRQLTVEVYVENPLEAAAGDAPSYRRWRERFASLRAPRGREAVLARAVDDLRSLLLFTEEGPLPAAGIPWFVAAFGRDALLTCAMLLPFAPEVSEATLRYLARRQGRKIDPFRAEAPGKIMHELRFGELTRIGMAPHSPYYGTVDATALFVVTLERLWRSTGRLDSVIELRRNWEAALRWLQSDGDPDGDGFVEFVAAEAGKGLTVQSWKDSDDSMSHSDGTLARGPLAVSEVQGYAYAAFRAAADFYEALGEGEEAERWGGRAAELRLRFHEAFWSERLGTYAMALDGDKRPLEVHNSDAGQLLWTGIVPPEAAPRLVESLFSEPNWSGWGFRTLGAGEARYDPLSYHNGSVWPHDTALIAGGLARYGFKEEAARVRDAIFDLAASQRDLRPPELVGGYPRSRAGLWPEPPVPYPVACRPQAWDSAALLYLLQVAG